MDGRDTGMVLALLGIAGYLLYSQPASATVDTGLTDTGGASPDLTPLTDINSAVNSQGAIMPVQNGTWITPSNGSQYEPYFQSASAQYGIPDGLLSRIAFQESDYNQSAVNPSSGARGLMQFMPATAAAPGYGVSPFDPFDPVALINAAAGLLAAWFSQFGDWALAIAAYDWGPGNVARSPNTTSWPAETRTYVANVTADTGLT